MRELCDSGVQVGQTLDGPTVGKRDRGQGPPRRRALGGEVAQRQRERAPSGVLRAHPAEVEIPPLDEHVAARDDESRRILQHRRVVLPCVRRQIRLDPFEQPELAEAFDFHDFMSMARRLPTACSGSRAPGTARMTHTRRNPSAINRPTFVSSMPPIANTGTPGPTSVAMAATPLGPMTFFSDLIGVAKAGPLPR